MSEERPIYKAVIQRGYKNNWTDGQFLARQVAKLQEEFAEFCKHLNLPLRLSFIQEAGRKSRLMFDEPREWQEPYIGLRGDPDKAIEELADMQVVIDCMVGVIEDITGKRYDLQEIAERKAKDDIVRGVRK